MSDDHREVIRMTSGGDMGDARNWERARDWIVRDIAARRLVEGDQLPPEQDIQRACGVGRHSVRRALAALAAEGRLSVEQGRGTFVRAQPSILYRIGRRTRFRENLRAAGVTPGSESIGAEVVAADATVAAALSLAPGAPVHRILRRGLADGVPVSITRSFHPALAFPDLGPRREAGESVTAIYRSHGIADYRRRETMLYARLPEKWEARLLEQLPDQPVVVMCKTDIAPDGTPIGWSEAIWAATRVRFEVADTEERPDA
jgi:GntR family transcriptional regulator, phosphonate transport system regulatory protein